MPKKLTKTKAKRQLKWHKSDSWFFERRAPDLPYWIFLVLGVLALVAFSLWLKNPNKQISPISLIAPIAPQATSPSATTSKTPTLLKTVTLQDAADPSLVAHNNKLYLTFRNNTGGYSVAVYDASLTELEAPRWITNGFSIPNQQQAVPSFADGNWYLAYLGGDNYMRLAKYDQDFNRQREITFKNPVESAKNISVSAEVETHLDPQARMVLGITINVNNSEKHYKYLAGLDLGGIVEKSDSDIKQAFEPKNVVIISGKRFTTEEVASTVVIKSSPL